MHCDSAGAISAQSRLGLGKLMKHVQLRQLFLQELVRLKRISLVKIHTNDNVADMLTKYLAKDALERHKKNIGLKTMSKDSGSISTMGRKMP